MSDGTLCDPTNRDAVKCNICGFICRAGITRLKYHIAGIKGKGVAVCKKATKEDKDVCVALLQKPKENKMREEEIENEVNVSRKRKKVTSLGGPMDKYVNPDASTTRQQNIVDEICKERIHQVHQYCARWVYEYCIPFHAIDNDGFRKFVEAVGQFGPDYRPPSQYQLLLKEEVEGTKGLLKNQWAQSWIVAINDDDEEMEESGSLEARELHF